MEPEKEDKDKRREISLPVHVCEGENVEGKMKPARIALELLLASTGPKTPGQVRLSSREIQQTAGNGRTHANVGLKLGRTMPLQIVVGMKPEEPTQLVAVQGIVILPMGWQ